MHFSTVLATITITLLTSSTASADPSVPLTITLYTDPNCSILPSNGSLTLTTCCAKNLDLPTFQSSEVSGPPRGGSYYFYADGNCEDLVGNPGTAMFVGCQGAGGSVVARSAVWVGGED
ncbi:hypothetical protein Tdes44962_MAKER03336 [Teratosphaeria destructans]|uniref:Cyanovirin-N domain-containing protein n=1 Tax=Teratosphaeria destructans TaxID=418781 RepID=A0A9W7W1N0_9PEZI|nr:hypothetical protein Tdes44962_MAKER03336 [Teratosphaeria destructans]